MNFTREKIIEKLLNTEYLHKKNIIIHPFAFQITIIKRGLLGSASMPSFKARAYRFTYYLQLAYEANTQLE